MTIDQRPAGEPPSGFAPVRPHDGPTQRDRLERNAAVLFVGAALVMAVICGAIIVSGWFAGAMEDHAERFFWGGSIVGLFMVFAFAVAVYPGGSDDARVIRRVRWFIRIGLLLFVAAPILCLGSLIADFYG